MNKYIITHANGSVDIVTGCKLEYVPQTGQTIILSTESLCGLYETVAVVPPTSFVKVQQSNKDNESKV